MPDLSFQVLRAGVGPAGPAPGAKPSLLIAGATGSLGNEVMQRLVGSQWYGDAHVLAREPMRTGLRGVQAHVVPGDDPAQWPPLPADVAVILFDPPRLFFDRERALWTPSPQQLLPLARWLRAGGVRTLAVVLPHAIARLPDALKRGIASVDEHELAMLGFGRLLIVRSAQKAPEARGGHALVRLARFMLAVTKYMVPSREQPVRAAKVAQFVGLALQLAPEGLHIAASETVWEAAQGDTLRAVAEWLSS